MTLSLELRDWHLTTLEKDIQESVCPPNGELTYKFAR